jgi:hypothetical protein
MAITKKSDVKFKYVNVIPNTVTAGTFYWKYENGVNQLYFAPTENESDLLRLDNIISGESGSIIVSDNIALVSIYDAQSSDTIIIGNTVTAWSDSDWESYISEITNEALYGSISNRPFSVGNVVICGPREFICKQSSPVYGTITVDGVTYYKSRVTGEPCMVDGELIESSSSIIPPDVEVLRYNNNHLVWECFGENLSRDLAEKIADFNMEINGSMTIRVDGNDSDGIYTLSVVLKENNPLSVTTKQGLKVVEISNENDDETGEETLMSAKQIKDILNDIIEDNQLCWIEEV